MLDKFIEAVYEEQGWKESKKVSGSEVYKSETKKLLNEGLISIKKSEFVFKNREIMNENVQQSPK